MFPQRKKWNKLSVMPQVRYEEERYVNAELEKTHFVL